jgi:hypothetical protein
LVLVVSVPLELIAALAGKGGMLVARATRDEAPQRSAEYENVDQ